jgi:hypothetical protein
MVYKVQTYGLALVNIAFSPPSSSLLTTFSLLLSPYYLLLLKLHYLGKFEDFFKKPQYLPKSSGMPLYKGFADSEVCLGNLPHTSLIPPSSPSGQERIT